MKRIVDSLAKAAGLALSLIVACWIAHALPKLDTRLAAIERRSASPAPAKSAEARIIDLPDDANTWHTILFLRPGWQSHACERRAHTMFFTERGLVALRQQTHWHVITTDQAEFQKFRALVSATPCLVVERANGEVIYRESGRQLGQNDAALRRAIGREVERHCPDGRCLPLHPTPEPDDPEPMDEIPSILKQPADRGEKSPVCGVVAVLAGLAAGMGIQWKKSG